MSPGLLRARAPYRAKNALLAFVAGVFAYALAAIKQDTFDDLDDAVRRAAMSAEDERGAMQMAAAHATGGGRGRMWVERARTGCGGTHTNACGDADAPALLERRAPWLLDPTRKTPVWAHGEHSASLWSSSSSPVAETLTDEFFRYASLVGALTHSFLTVELATWRTLRALDAESELDARRLWTLLALQAAALASTKPRPPGCTATNLTFTAFLTVLVTYAASHARSSRSSRPMRRVRAGLSALFADMLVLPAIRLCFLLAVSTHHAHLVVVAPGAATAESATAAPPAERARGARGADAGLLDARVPPSAYLRLPPSERYLYAASVYIPPPTLLPVPAPVILTLRTYIHTIPAPPYASAPSHFLLPALKPVRYLN
ncbi:hypothetical protein FB451DRAFT_1527659 [Mycena latifolia]|nr:hypothetical protein FB451DRAFT_1527659 [Mycena latifolia]